MPVDFGDQNETHKIKLSSKKKDLPVSYDLVTYIQELKIPKKYDTINLV